MNVKGGVAYIDFKGRSFTTATGVIDDVFKNIVNAWKSKKIIVICNAKMGNEVLPFITTFPVRKRDDTHYTFSVPITNLTGDKVTLKSVVVYSTNNVTISDASIA